jgi:hypothetical protein
MKMLANVGGGRGEEAAGNLDDGIRTGWICCTIGRIEAHPEDTHVPGVSGQENFVGFRDVKPGVNVVVQMFTEEKRAEIDLETLWDGVLKTHERKDAVAEEQLRELEEKLDEDVVREAAEREARRKAEVDAKDASTKTTTSPPMPATPTPTQSSDAPVPRTWNRGAVFPPASSQPSARQIRRLHTVGFNHGSL